MAFAVTNLSKYDLLVRNWTKEYVNDKVAAIGIPLTIKGRKDTFAEVQALTDMKAGDVWIVGAEADIEKVEYVYTTENVWELLGTTAVSLEGYVNETALYKGAEGLGTVETPADGTILAGVTKKAGDNADAIAAINAEDTGILAQAKEYADSLVDEDSAIAQRVAALETAVEDTEIEAMFTANTTTLG